MTISELLANATPVSVPKGKNLHLIGWHDGYLVVQFKGRRTKYIYGSGIAKEEMNKIVANPFPDALFTKLRNKHAWQCKKVEAR